LNDLEKFSNLINSPIVFKAFVYASAAHAAIDQRRKYTGDPYIVHPVEVCCRVSEVEHTPEMLAAALLHDTVEDTEITIENIEQMFGKIVANLVSWLTDISKPEDGNRATRKAIDRKHTHLAPKAAQTIKVADLIANTKDITEFDIHFAKVYVNEKRLLLEGMNADEKLMKEAWEMVEKFEKGIEETEEIVKKLEEE